MKLRLALVGVLVGTVASPAGAQYARVPTVSIMASPNPVTFSSPVRITGRLRKQGSRRVLTVQASSDRANWSDVGRVRTSRSGSYRIGQRPERSTYYRVLAPTTPPTESRPLLVRVRPLVGFRLSDQTPAIGSRVGFSGIVRPPHNGRRTYIQKRTPSGRWVTVARVRLRALDATTSRYSRRLRVRRSGAYRVRVLGHEDHVMGISRERMVLVH